MKHRKPLGTKTNAIYSVILYACSLVLFLEWLYPVDEVTDTNRTGVFILYTLFCFVISAVHVRWWLSIIAKGIGLLFVMNRLFFNETFFKMAWLSELWEDLGHNVTLIGNQNWYHLTASFRSLLFLILIWLMSYLLYYWFVTMKYVFVFVALTIVYIALLDTFTSYNGEMAIVRVVFVSLAALGLSNLLKEQARERIPLPRFKKSLTRLLPLGLVVLVLVAFGYATPKFSAQWPDPVPFFERIAGKPGAFGTSADSRSVGYGEDDSELGGSFTQDDTPVFEAEAPEKQYWRIETKDVYTGKGWEQSEDESFDEQNNEDIELDTFSDEVETETHEADLSFTDEAALQKLIYPYGIEAVQAEDSAEFLLDATSEAIQTNRDGRKTSLSSYTITYEQPSFEKNSLQEAGDSDPDDIQDRYTQLPDELPDRVEEIAEDITENYSNRYDQANAIEQYFGENGFQYQISDVPVPDEDEDYVDQFLYHTKAGYCDNYSTSMAVMLRTLDIPTRWAKGFTGGEKMDEKEEADGETRGVYEVTKANAHSWVEVYFPDIGWVPFEPTQGFSNQADFYEETDDIDEEFEAEEGELPDAAEEVDGDSEDVAADMSTNYTKAKKSEEDSSSFSVWYGVAIAALLVVLSGYVYTKRFHIRAYLFRRKWSQQQDEINVYRRAYLFLLRLLKHKGLEKNPEQTLREYANSIDRKHRENGMKQLTVYYEQMVYNKETANVNCETFEHIWERLVNKLLERRK